MPTRTAAKPLLLRRRVGAIFIAALFLMTSTLVGCTPSTGEKDSPDAPNSVTNDLPEAASSSDRIAAALVADQIDKPTSLLYRMWAQFGDRSLPEPYRGAPERHDLSVFGEVQDNLESMPTEIRDQLEPFLQRPSSPDSAFSGPDEATETTDSANSAQAETVHPATIHAVAQSDDSADDQRCSQSWVSHGVPDLPFRVWACPDDGVEAAERTIATVSDALSARVGNMILDAPNGMGAPIPDEPDADVHQPSDEKIDIYVLPHGRFAPYRDLNERHMDEMAAAITMPAAPRTDNTSSAYMLLGSYLLDHPEALERVLVHEVFHVLQFSHFNGLDPATAWIFEASAVWAETHFAPDLSEHAYRHHMTGMQNSELSLLDTDFGHRYSAFLWFLFMQQEAGPEAVFGMWHALDSAPAGAGSDSVVAAIDSQLNLESVFSEFAMRMLNADLPGDPVTPRFSEIAPNFPDGEMPELDTHPFNGDSLTLDHNGVPGLGYRYTRVTLPDPAETGMSVRVSGDLQAPSGISPSIEALVESPDGDYTRVSIDPTGTDLCVASDLLLVVTNPSGAIEDEVTGAIELIQGEGSSCDDPAQAPSEPPSSVVPPTHTESNDGPTGDYCTDLLQFEHTMQGLANGNDLPVTAQRVAEIFAFAEPHLPNVPDGGIEQVEILRSYTEQAADQPAASAASILANEEFQRLTNGISFLVQFCENAE